MLVLALPVVLGDGVVWMYGAPPPLVGCFWSLRELVLMTLCYCGGLSVRLFSPTMAFYSPQTDYMWR